MNANLSIFGTHITTALSRLAFTQYQVPAGHSQLDSWRGQGELKYQNNNIEKQYLIERERR